MRSSATRSPVVSPPGRVRDRSLHAASAAGGPAARAPTSPKSAGFSLHAGVSSQGGDRDKTRAPGPLHRPPRARHRAARPHRLGPPALHPRDTLSRRLSGDVIRVFGRQSGGLDLSAQPVGRESASQRDAGRKVRAHYASIDQEEERAECCEESAKKMGGQTEIGEGLLLQQRDVLEAGTSRLKAANVHDADLRPRGRRNAPTAFNRAARSPRAGEAARTRRQRARTPRANYGNPARSLWRPSAVLKRRGVSQGPAGRSVAAPDAVAS
jgi:hypothetical protein